MSIKIQTLIFVFFAMPTIQQSCPDSIFISSYSSSSICNYQYQYLNATCSFKVCLLQSSKTSQTSNVGWIQCFS